MTQARVFAVTQQDADISPDVVTGMISVFNRGVSSYRGFTASRECLYR